MANVPERHQALDSALEWRNKLTELRKENQALEDEAEALRSFIRALRELMNALQSPREESDVLTLFESVLDKARRAADVDDRAALARVKQQSRRDAR